MLLKQAGEARAIETVPEIIRAAASSDLGLVALVLVGGGALLYLMFNKAPYRIRVPLFASVLIGACLLVVAAVVQGRRAGAAEATEIPLPGGTGWLFLGYFSLSDSAFDADGRKFEFERRSRKNGPDIPVKGDVLRLSATRRVMIRDYLPNHSTARAKDLICAGYDENRDDTGIRLPKGTLVVVRDVGNSCYDPSQGSLAALWVRVGYVAR